MLYVLLPTRKLDQRLEKPFTVKKEEKGQGGGKGSRPTKQGGAKFKGITGSIPIS